MPNSVYQINKGINRPIYFKGLKAQYIGYLAVGLVFLMILFAILYFIAVPILGCVLLIAFLGIGFTMRIYRLSNRYGEHGLLKRIAKRKLPSGICCRTRMIFRHLGNNKTAKNETQ